MDIGAIIALTSIVGSLALATVVIAGAWALGRVHEQRNALSRGGGPEAIEARLARIEQMLETLSTDVERIAEERRGPLLPRM